ncbi:FtsX-like permease family protein [Pseudodesulfovibrio senegalensis]|uniref:FtsX-like permease family protein n=1 Tax=Pseudodesulfovibrio senegalensis TaxID=1721087 RepID=A0A6N6MYM9_9BACT|nr:FtsX-like permease family protein [Pseudodesulfovibrio senegalensis]KAB1439005.1 FtsX-like permease family protein [Pseudodesulfovibrio senegalensis]
MRTTANAFLFLLLVVACMPHAAQAAWHGEAFVRAMAALEDRSPGMPGASAAADMVERQWRLDFKSLNPTLGRQTFRVPTIRQLGATLTLNNGATVKLRQLRNNVLSPGAVTPPGISGNLIYAAKGRLADFNGMDPQGAVVMLDMDSGRNWGNAALLGARALIFIGSGNDPTPKALFENKVELTPVDLPMFWMSETEAEARFRGRLTPGAPSWLDRVLLTSKARWEQARVQNVYCMIPGTDPKRSEQVLILEAPYDSTAYVNGHAPGADEASSMATLMEIARDLRKNPPARSVLLLGTGAHSQAQAGMREFTAALVTENSELAEQVAGLEKRLERTARVRQLLDRPEPLAIEGLAPDEVDMLREAFRVATRNAQDLLTNDLMRMRMLARGKGLQKDVAPQDGKTFDIKRRIKRVAARRLKLKRLYWVQSSRTDVGPDPEEAEILLRYLEPARHWQGRVHRDLAARLESAQSALRLKEVLGERRIAAHMSLYLSSHGKGVGGFDKGWLYDLKPEVNRTRFFSPVHDLFQDAAATLPKKLKPLYHGTLRPSRLRTWESYLPDTPEMGGEPMALAGFPGFTLATVHDVRPAWKTPYDQPDRVDFGYLRQQAQVVRTLARALVDKPLADAGKRAKDRFVVLGGRANLMRKGEIFPDKPGTDMVVLCYQWATRTYGMVDTDGRFRIPGLASKKVSYHKAVLEGLRFDQDTGLAQWAVDKPKTGKDAYRVKLKRNRMETDLTLFTCTQTTVFNMFDSRTFKYLYRPKLIDARTEAPPVSYWYSRLDTRQSTMGTLFLEPDVPIKLTLSDTVLDKKELLLNADPEHPQGVGYLARSWPTIPMTEYRAANDMWNLVTPRVRNLETKGIVNQRVRDLTRKGREELEQAREYRGELRWDAFMEASRSSLAKATRVYNEVDSIQKDVLVGVLFYVALFMPFAYCMERLLFGFADIKKRIGAFLGLLTAIIGAVYLVHPAFELTYSPMVVILAFFILTLSLLVSMIIFFRFEREMVELQRRSKHMKLTDISPAAAFTAAFVLGVGNLRRRPVRTALTLATLVILTFTIMNFTTVKSVNQKGWSEFSDTASYHGLFMKNFNWTDLPTEALNVVSDAYRGKGVVAPRVWYETGMTGDKSHAPVIPLTMKDRTANARAVIGLSYLEPQVSGLDRMLVEGRWFTPGERHVCMLPERIARQLDVRPGGSVSVWGVSYTVTGIFADTGLRDNPDLDGEPMTPIVYPSRAAVQMSEVEAEAMGEGEDVVDYESRYQHIAGYDTVIIPAELLLSLGRTGHLKGLAVRETDPDSEATLGDRFGLMIFRGGPDGTSLFFTSNTVNYSGVANILIPLCISILIVLNTMIGSVHERRPEIAVYTSVGLAPPHVAFLFIAEALAFAVISVVIGYLLAQVSAVALSGTALWEGMTANYSSTAGVAAMVLVILVVVISALYPARVAARIAIPDVNRSWTMPEAKGDTLTVVLPFLINLREQASAGGFLHEYYRTHLDVSHGAFSTADIGCSFIDAGDSAAVDQLALMARAEDMLSSSEICFRLEFRAWLAPFDFGVRQKVDLHFCPSDIYRGYRQIQVTLMREAGEHKAWENLNRNFLNDLRKQLLAWRALDDESVQGYASDLAEHFSERTRQTGEVG